MVEDAGLHFLLVVVEPGGGGGLGPVMESRGEVGVLLMLVDLLYMAASNRCQIEHVYMANSISIFAIIYLDLLQLGLVRRSVLEELYGGGVVAVLVVPLQHLEPAAAHRVHHAPAVREILDVTDLQHRAVVREPAEARN